MDLGFALGHLRLKLWGRGAAGVSEGGGAGPVGGVGPGGGRCEGRGRGGASGRGGAWGWLLRDPGSAPVGPPTHPADREPVSPSTLHHLPSTLDCLPLNDSLFSSFLI